MFVNREMLRLSRQPNAKSSYANEPLQFSKSVYREAQPHPLPHGRMRKPCSKPWGSKGALRGLTSGGGGGRWKLSD